MLEIRCFEDECHRMFGQGLVRGSTPLCQGQEAVVVGASRALREGDTMSCTYRGHGAVLAMGSPLDRAFGEILGKAAGLCGGKGGSMHLTDVERGVLGSLAIVGAHCRSPPAIYVCENNLYGEYSPIATTTPIERLADRADAYGMAKAVVDGNDVLAMHAAVGEAAPRARVGEGPTMIEALTYRQKGHSRSDRTGPRASSSAGWSATRSCSASAR